MGVTYLVFQLREEIVPWLMEHDIRVPSPLPESRFPTLHELTTVLEQMDGYRIAVRRSASDNSVDIDVIDRRGSADGWSTTVWAKSLDAPSHPPGDGDSLQVSFHKGSPELAMLIVERLTPICGPLVLIDENATPVLLGADGGGG